MAEVVESVGRGAGSVSVAGSGVSVTAEGAQAVNIKSTSKGIILVFISFLLYGCILPYSNNSVRGNIIINTDTTRKVPENLHQYASSPE
jgi:hypothetical protein